MWDTQTKKQRTAVVEDNTNPLYYETIDLHYEVSDPNNIDTYPPFIFDIYDHDDELFDSTPDFMCRAVIIPKEASILCFENDMIQEEGKPKWHSEVPKLPKWHPCYFAPGLPKCGDILVSFAVVDPDYEFQHRNPKENPLSSLVEMKEYNIDLLILGLRDLQSPGILPVKKAFIMFDVKSLVPPGGPAVKNIKTNPCSPGPNPTLNTTMKFSIPLPTD